MVYKSQWKTSDVTVNTHLITRENKTYGVLTKIPVSYQPLARNQKMELELATVIVVLDIFNIVINSFACYLLVTIYKNGTGTVEQLYLINLCVTELASCVFILLEEMPDIFPMSDEVHMIFKKVDNYLYIIIYILFCEYYLNMIYISVDRFLDIYLNIKYPSYWNEKKTKYLIIFTWVITTALCVTVSVLYKYTTFDYEVIFTKYIHSVLNFGFCALVTCIYSYIFHAYKKTRAAPTENRNSDVPRSHSVHNLCQSIQRSYEIFRDSRFYIAVLLVLSFLLFMVVPNLVYLFYGLPNNNKHDIKDTAKIFYQISFISNAWIYCFVVRRVRTELRKVFLSCRSHTFGNNNADDVSTDTADI